MKEIYAFEDPLRKTFDKKPSIFLAGPSPRDLKDLNWRCEQDGALEYMNKKRFQGLVFVPLPRKGLWGDNYDGQIDWELKYLRASTVIVFWIPRDLQKLPGFTTNVEFGLFVESKKVILGHPEKAPKTGYLDYLAKLNNVPIYHTLEATLDKGMKLADTLFSHKK